MGWKSDKDGNHFNGKKRVRDNSGSPVEVNVEIDNNSDDFSEGIKKDFGNQEMMYGSMSKPLQIENLLKDIFETNNVEYYGRSHQNDKHIYFVSTKEVTPEMQSKWSEKFREASFYSIAKGREQDHLNLTVDVTDDDIKNNT